jgi:hypothetical protein
MLLLAAAADAKMRAARRLALRAVVEAAFYRGVRVLFFLVNQHDLSLLLRQQAANKQRFSLVTRNALTKGIEVIDCNGYDLARRHTPFCRVELRHRRDLSQ